jgi:nucleoid-associated protein EbfC
MFKELTGFANLLRNAQGIGPRFQEINEQLKTKRVHGSAEDGLIKVEMNGIGELLVIQICPTLMSLHQHERLQELIPVAVNEASSKAKQAYAEAIKAFVAELNLPIPGLDKLLSQFK